jgi:hypothetical protein
MGCQMEKGHLDPAIYTHPAGCIKDPYPIEVSLKTLQTIAEKGDRHQESRDL